LSCSIKDLPLQDKTYLYELNPDGFEQNTEGEFYSTNEITPLSRREFTIEEALREFDEVHFLQDEMRIRGEGTTNPLL
jgi:hypothetical protein